MAQYEITDEPYEIDFEGINDDVKRTVQNCKNLLMCRKGEIPFDRERGLDPALFDMPLSQAEPLLLPELDRVMLWEPDAEVVSGRFDRDAAGRTIIRCVVEINDDEEGE